jgi:DNA-binding transcriptional ArsR family regulator
MISTAAIAKTAALVGDPARTNMLAALMDGRALTAAELAGAAGITPQTASAHLARLGGDTATTVWRRGPSRTCWKASWLSPPSTPATVRRPASG